MTSQARAISLPHLYWHFLVWQNVLDNRAAELSAQGKSGDMLRNDLQRRLGFSDADYAPVRTSSQRLASEMSAIDEQLKTFDRSSGDAGQLRTILSQRDTYISNEMYVLSHELSSQNKQALEKFMAQFFAPKTITFKTPPVSGPSPNNRAPLGVQQ